MKYSRRMQKVVEVIARAHDVDLAQRGTHIKVERSDYMPLVIEQVGMNDVNLVSVAHYYEQNGDLCQDPEIVFLVGCDGEWYPIEWTTPAVMLFGRVCGGYRRYVELDDKGNWTRANLRGQRELATFANRWADNIKAQGFAL